MNASGPTLHVIDLLDTAAREVREEWEKAMADADFERVTALTEAGQAVHRALLAFDGARIG